MSACLSRFPSSAPKLCRLVGHTLPISAQEKASLRPIRTATKIWHCHGKCRGMVAAVCGAGCRSELSDPPAGTSTALTHFTLYLYFVRTYFVHQTLHACFTKVFHKHLTLERPTVLLFKISCERYLFRSLSVWMHGLL